VETGTMRTFGLILAAAAVAVNGAGVAHDDTGNIVITPSEGTTVFMESDGSQTSVRAMLGKFEDVTTELTNTKNDITADLEATKDSVAKDLADAADALQEGLDTIAPALDDAKAEVDLALGTLKTELKKDVADVKGSITTIVQPQIDGVKKDLVALKTEINENVDGKLSGLTKAVMGTSDALPAANCAAILAAKKFSPDGAYWIGSVSAPIQVWCAKVGGSFVSLGGDGSTKAKAAADCFAQPLVGAYNPSDQKKYIDPDANADNTNNAVKKMCAGNGLSKTSAARTCKEIKINFKTSKNGIYWLAGRNNELKSEPFQAYCWNTDRDGGGWTMFLRSYYEGHQRPTYNGNGVSDSGDVNDDVLQFLGGAYKLHDKKIRAIIGQKDITDDGRSASKKKMFSYMVDQSKWNNYYSSNNNEYGIMKQYTARWRFHRFQQMDSSSTAEKFTSYKIPNFDGKTPVGDGTVNWSGRPRCGSRYVGGGGGAGISCRGTHNGSPRREPYGGNGCKSNTSRRRWGGGFHLYMLNTNHDTYFYSCNGPQHSSHRRFAHRWYIRTPDSDKVA